ncbi:MAG: redoxin domain-containing protein [Acidobacteriota bacterium]
MRCLPLAVLVLLAGCAAAPPPPESDTEAARDTYRDLQRRAREDLLAWQRDGGRDPDPRLKWSAELLRFARTYPASQEAVEATTAAMGMAAAARDVEGFFAAYGVMLRIAPDSPELRASLNQVGLMRMVEAGGVGIIKTTDKEAKTRAYRRAVPRIVSDLERALEASTDPDTVAAAHYAIGKTYYELDNDLPKALEHFRVVAQEHADSHHAGSARAYVHELEDLAVGKPAPDFSALTLDGGEIALSSLRGKVVLLDFWATWCQPCIDEMPSLRSAYDRWHDQGFDIIGVNMDDDLEQVRRFVMEHELPWTVVAAGKGMFDPLSLEYSVQAIPMSYLIDREGTIRDRALFGDDVIRAVSRLIHDR